MGPLTASDELLVAHSASEVAAVAPAHKRGRTGVEPDDYIVVLKQWEGDD